MVTQESERMVILPGGGQPETAAATETPPAPLAEAPTPPAAAASESPIVTPKASPETALPVSTPLTPNPEQVRAAQELEQRQAALEAREAEIFQQSALQDAQRVMADLEAKGWSREQAQEYVGTAMRSYMQEINNSKIAKRAVQVAKARGLDYGALETLLASGSVREVEMRAQVLEAQSKIKSAERAEIEHLKAQVTKLTRATVQPQHFTDGIQGGAIGNDAARLAALNAKPGQWTDQESAWVRNYLNRER